MNKNNDLTESDLPEPLEEGKLELIKVQEGKEPFCRTIEFNPPLMVDYFIFEKKDSNVDGPAKVAYFTFDFGMTGQVGLTPESNFLVNGYDGLSKDSTLLEVLTKTLTFDLFHAFTHCSFDPNYTAYHWALVGWLQDRAKVTDFD